MGSQKEIPGKQILDQIADESGTAIAVVDRSEIEIAVSNNNSICRNLNSEGEFSRECAAFCGKALEEVAEIGGPVSFTCHAGLECRVTPMMFDGKTVAVIAGRAFARAENYRKATERAISGDWHTYAPSQFFDNILLVGSISEIEQVSARIEAAGVETVPEPEPPAMIEQVADTAEADAVAQDDDVLELDEPMHAPEPEPIRELIPEPTPEPKPKGESTAPPPIPRVAIDPRKWRSFFSKLLTRDYASACEALLEFLSRQYALESLAWLERRDNRLIGIAATGTLKNRKLRFGLPADDPRLAEAVRSEMPVELSERAKGNLSVIRTMYVFPVPVGTDVPSAFGVLDPIDDEGKRRQIARLCQWVGPQLEILRLRSEVARRETMSVAVRKFGEGLKHVDSVDFWLHLTQVAAELMQAERGSLLVVDALTGELKIKASVGAVRDIAHAAEPGGRVARTILERGTPLVVADVSKTGLPANVSERGYKTGSFLSAPITLGGRNIAIINFTDKASGAPFDRADLDLLQEISPQIAVAVDRALLKEKAGEFQQLSVTDALTGLLNRRYIEERLIEEVKRSNRHGYPMSFILLDVDNFKSYNDTYGHPAGDEALKIVGAILRDTLRGADVAARFGGEEFSILLPQTTIDEAVAIAERIRANVEAAQFPCRKVTVSLGVATCTSELCTTSGIVKAADKALYAAKHAGRNSVRVAEEVMAT